jgi:alkylation response protein AidB-like acyl-CoA dehydrogenase
MEFDLSDDDAMFVDSVRQLGRDQLAPHAVAWDEAGRIPDGVLAQLGQLGLLGMEVPETAGGVGLSTVAATAILEEVARHAPALAWLLAAHNVLAVGHLLRAGDESQRRAWLGPWIEGPAVAAWALPEATPSPAATRAPRTTARRVGSGWVLDGGKHYVTAGRHAAQVVVFAEADADAGAPTAFLVDADARGLSVAAEVRSLGLRAAAVAHLSLFGVEVGDDRRLGEVGAAGADATALLDRHAIAVAAVACGIVDAALVAARDYALQREQFGGPIAGFQAIQWKLADMATGLDAARALTMQAAWMRDAGRPFAAAASRAKVFASELASRACSDALQIHGGYGYTTEFPVERLLRDAKATQVGGGTSQASRVRLGASIAERFGG